MISIVIPTYNRAHFIPRAINSVLSQNFEDWELIIVDDGSRDNTAEVVEDFLKDKRISFCSIENSGGAKARNVGAQKAKGEFITFLDSDDEAREDWLSSFYAFLKDGAELVCCGFETFNNDGKLLKKKLPKKMGSLYDNITARFNAGTYIVKKQYFDAAGGFDAKLTSGHHSEMAIRLLDVLKENNVEIKNIHEPLIKVHVHNDLKIRKDFEAIYKGSTSTLDKHEELFLQNETKLYNYLSVAALAAIKTKRYKEGQQLFLRAFKLKPLKLKSHARLYLSHLPVLRDILWKK